MCSGGAKFGFFVYEKRQKHQARAEAALGAVHIPGLGVQSENI